MVPMPDERDGDAMELAGRFDPDDEAKSSKFAVGAHLPLMDLSSAIQLGSKIELKRRRQRKNELNQARMAFINASACRG
eukprot:10470274-Prorocentrum_lima.AAC.1